MTDGTATARDAAAVGSGRARRAGPRIVSGLALLGGAGWGLRHLAEGGPARPAPTAAAATAAPTVPVATARAGDLAVGTTGLGTVQPFNTVTVKPRVGGRIAGVDFTEGQAVSVGDALAHIDRRAFLPPLHQAQANLAEDEAQLDNVETDLGRTTNLAQRGLGMGVGSELRRPLGIAVVGGLAVSQLLTLYTTPVIYLHMQRFGARVAGLRGRARGRVRAIQPAPAG